MLRHSTRGAVAAGLVACLAIAASSAPSESEAQRAENQQVHAQSEQDALTRQYRTAALLPDDLLAQLPTTAAEAGLDFAPRLVLVQRVDQVERSAIAASGLDVTEHAGHDYVEVVISDQEQLDLLDSLGVDYVVKTADMIAQEYDRIMADAAYARATAVSPLPSGRDTYRVLADYGTEIDALVSDNPNLAKRISVGESVEGRDLTGIEITVDVNAADDGRPVLLMFGNHHAREWPSAETPMEFAHDLVNTFNDGDARTIDLLKRARVIIVPVSNPDGYDASRTSGDLVDLNAVEGGGTVSILATPGNAYKRKNCRIIDGQTQPAGACVLFSSPGGYGVGVDLNRNYGALWGGPGADDLGASAIYHGPAPFSEPETQAIRELISTRQVTTLISNHTFSNLLLRPVGIVPDTEHPDGFPIGFAPDECFTTADGSDYGMQALGERMTAQTGYSNQFGWELYDTTGTTEDYSYNATGGYGYTFEIGPDQFHPAFEEVVNEYTGATDSAQAITPETAPFLTTAVGRDCPGDHVEHDTVGGGLREAYFIALENAANSRTHSVIEGTAPAGAEITVTREGDFPLWDGSAVADTVTTTMTVPAGDAFEYHVNPSTRPFADSRAYVEGEVPAPVITETSTEDVNGDVTSTPPNQSSDHAVTVPAGVDAITVTMTADVPSDDYDLTLLSPDLVPLGASAGGDSNEVVQFYRAGGIQPGDYTIRVTNFAATGPWTVTASQGTIPDSFAIDYVETPRAAETWTLTCALNGEVIDTEQVSVDRGEAVDMGDLCVVAAGTDVEEAPDPAPDTDTEADLAATGGGAMALALLTLAGAAALRRRREDDDA